MPETGLFHFRVHYEPYDVNDIVKFITERAQAVLIVKEIGNRPHIHSVITEFKQTKSTFVQQFTKQFHELKGNKSYSCEKKDDLEAQLRYLCKGNSVDDAPDVLYSNDIDIQSYHSQYWQVNCELLTKVKSEGNMGFQKGTSLKKPKSKAWLERVYDEIGELYVNEVMSIQTFPQLYRPTDYEKKSHEEARKIIFRYFMKALGRGVKKISPRIIQEMFDGIINSIIQTNSTSADIFSDKMYNALYSNTL